MRLCPFPITSSDDSSMPVPAYPELPTTDAVVTTWMFLIGLKSKLSFQLLLRMSNVSFPVTMVFPVGATARKSTFR